MDETATSVEEGDLLRPSEVAEALGVSRQTVVNWLTTGKVQGLKLPSGQYRVYRDSIQAMVTAASEEGEAEE